MLDLLARLIGPSRAVSAYVAVQRFGIPVGLALGFAGILVWLFAFSHPDTKEHLSYLRVDVIEQSELGGGNHGILVDVRLPDGELVRLTESEGMISATLTETACVEALRAVADGSVQYRLRLPHRCDS